MLGSAVQPRLPLARLLIDVPAEFRRDDGLITKRGDCLAQNALAFVRTIGLGKVAEGHAAVKGLAEQRDLLGLVGPFRRVLAEIVLHADAQTGNSQSAQTTLSKWSAGRPLRLRGNRLRCLGCHARNGLAATVLQPEAWFDERSC